HDQIQWSKEHAVSDVVEPALRDLHPSPLLKRRPDVAVLIDEVHAEELLVELQVNTEALEHLEENHEAQVFFRVVEAALDGKPPLVDAGEVLFDTPAIHVAPPG